MEASGSWTNGTIGICECTSYVADKLNERGVPFTDRYKGVLWKGAGTWINAATQAGVPYNKTPRRGDVAWFAYGHVAYVEAVDSYGDVTISEYNWGHPHDYHTRTVNRGRTVLPCLLHSFLAPRFMTRRPQKRQLRDASSWVVEMTSRAFRPQVEKPCCCGDKRHRYRRISLGLAEPRYRQRSTNSPGCACD